MFFGSPIKWGAARNDKCDPDSFSDQMKLLLKTFFYPVIITSPKRRERDDVTRSQGTHCISRVAKGARLPSLRNKKPVK